MYQFIVLLRALAAVIITNAHYEAVYPVSIIANGGLLGDVIFFAISGFCLYIPKQNIVEWYFKRLKRVYFPVWMITIIYLIAGVYSPTSLRGYLSLLIYPTYYHFIASLLVLYVIYYIVIKVIDCSKKDNEKLLRLSLGGVFVIHCVLYFTIYDRSYYHIDSVYEPMIRFLFFEAMLIGAIIRENSEAVVKGFRPKILCEAALFAGLYFASKLAFTKYSQFAGFQLVNQIILLGLLTRIFLIAGGFEAKICMIPVRIYKIIEYIASITLEIYLVQYALIPRLNIGRFPVNFVVVTGGIFVAASILHFISEKVLTLVENVICKRD